MIINYNISSVVAKAITYNLRVLVLKDIQKIWSTEFWDTIAYHMASIITINMINMLIHKRWKWCSKDKILGVLTIMWKI